MKMVNDDIIVCFLFCYNFELNGKCFDEYCRPDVLEECAYIFVNRFPQL